jgi:hypothetical protein
MVSSKLPFSGVRMCRRLVLHPVSHDATLLPTQIEACKQGSGVSSGCAGFHSAARPEKALFETKMRSASGHSAFQSLGAWWPGLGSASMIVTTPAVRQTRFGWLRWSQTYEKFLSKHLRRVNSSHFRRNQKFKRPRCFDWRDVLIGEMF